MIRNQGSLLIPIKIGLSEITTGSSHPQSSICLPTNGMGKQRNRRGDPGNGIRIVLFLLYFYFSRRKRRRIVISQHFWNRMPSLSVSLSLTHTHRLTTNITEQKKKNRIFYTFASVGVWGLIILMDTGYSSFLKNKYYVLRHGKSIPNEKGLIVSSLENGILEEYQLSSAGIHQARLAGESFLKELNEKDIGLENIRICYSPFSRTLHTAKVVASVLNLPFEGPQCKVIMDLRERFFGHSFELMSHDKYPEIWAMDEKDPFIKPEGGESVADVVTRLARALTIMESEFEGCTVLVVSHGDPLQILQTILNAAVDQGKTKANDLTSRIQAIKVPNVLSQHRKFALNTGELRQLV